jgi:hypothetical protein
MPAAGKTKAETRCLTHDWLFDGRVTLTCPIGRIEAAAEEAIKRLRAEHDALKTPA